MGVIRLIIIIVLFILIYYVLKGFGNRGRNGTAGNASGPNSKKKGTEELVQDPYSGVFFPKSEGIASLIEGRVLYFLNTESRDKYLKERQGKNNGGST